MHTYNNSLPVTVITLTNNIICTVAVIVYFHNKCSTYLHNVGVGIQQHMVLLSHKFICCHFCVVQVDMICLGWPFV
jgi:hypothetical protein